MRNFVELSVLFFSCRRGTVASLLINNAKDVNIRLIYDRVEYLAMRMSNQFIALIVWLDSKVAIEGEIVMDYQGTGSDSCNQLQYVADNNNCTYVILNCELFSVKMPLVSLLLYVKSSNLARMTCRKHNKVFVYAT